MSEGKIVDLAGHPISSETKDTIIDLGGRKLSSNGAKPRVIIKGLIVSAVCSDGNMRQVTFDQKQSRKLTRFLLRLQGGAIQLQKEPVFLIMRKSNALVANGKEAKPA